MSEFEACYPRAKGARDAALTAFAGVACGVLTAIVAISGCSPPPTEPIALTASRQIAASSGARDATRALDDHLPEALEDAFRRTAPLAKLQLDTLGAVALDPLVPTRRVAHDSLQARQLRDLLKTPVYVVELPTETRRARVMCDDFNEQTLVFVDGARFETVVNRPADLFATPDFPKSLAPETPRVHLDRGAVVKPSTGLDAGVTLVEYAHEGFSAQGFVESDALGQVYPAAQDATWFGAGRGEMVALREVTHVFDRPGDGVGVELAILRPTEVPGRVVGDGLTYIDGTTALPVWTGVLPSEPFYASVLGPPEQGFLKISVQAEPAEVVGWVAESSVQRHPVLPPMISGGGLRVKEAQPVVEVPGGARLYVPGGYEPIGVIKWRSDYHCADDCEGRTPIVTVNICVGAVDLRVKLDPPSQL